MNLRLGIDIGTSGVRTAVIDEAGGVVSTARADHLAQDPGRIDAEKWWQAVQICLINQANALAAAGQGMAQITGIAVDGTSGSMVVTDQNLIPVSRALMYNSTGFEAEAQKIAKYAPENHITQGSNSALGRAVRLVGEAGETAAYLLHQADFIAAKLMEQGGYSDHTNALKTGFDPEDEAWPDWMDAVIDRALLPNCKPTGDAFDHIAPHIADQFGFAKDATVYAGTTDSTAAFLAAAPMGLGVAVTSLGSTLAIKLLTDKRIDDPSIGLYSHRVGGLWLVGGASNTGGAVLAQHFTPDQIKKLSTDIDPDRPLRLGYYPLKEPGERFPINDPHLPPKLSPRPPSDVAFLQALFEGIADIEAQCYQAVVDRGGVFPNMILSAGGGAHNPVFTKIRARALGVTPQIPLQTEASIGAAKLAGGTSVLQL